MAINNAGSVNASFTRNSAFAISGKAVDISGREGEMVITDMTVKVLTNNRVSFSAVVFLGIIYRRIW
jgi:hypothetical protein